MSQQFLALLEKSIFLRHLLQFGKILLLLLFFQPAHAQKEFTAEQQRSLRALVEDSPVFNRGFTGFALFDPEERAYLHSYQADKYFTPASNAKVLTLFTAINLLGEGMPMLFYRDLGDTLLIWGTGYPMLYHPDFVEADTLGRWLAAQPEQTIVLSTSNWRDVRFGEGWSWDDYPYGYQMEKAALPLYGNAVHFSKNGHLDSLQMEPALFRDALIYQSPPSPTVGRLEDRNIFTFGPRALSANRVDRNIPFRYEPPIAAALLSEALDKTVYWSADTLTGDYQILRAPVPDTLYRQLMQDSDNYVAEQLILLCSAQHYGFLNSESLIGYARDTLLRGLPQPIDWVDGSGLSRYNQFTPQAMVMVLEQLYRLLPQERLFDIFPAGGESGTIRRWYGGANDTAPYVFAKTGTLRHMHCLSGYIQTKAGHTYIFSFMHNNFPGQMSDLKEEMEVVLEWISEEL